MNAPIARQPSGSSAGGRFAPTDHLEAEGVTVGDDPTADHPILLVTRLNGSSSSRQQRKYPNLDAAVRGARNRGKKNPGERIGVFMWSNADTARPGDHTIYQGNLTDMDVEAIREELIEQISAQAAAQEAAATSGEVS